MEAAVAAPLLTETKLSTAVTLDTTCEAQLSVDARQMASGPIPNLHATVRYVFVLSVMLYIVYIELSN